MGRAILALSTAPSLAAEKSGALEVVFLAQLITLMLVGRLLGEIMNRIGQPSVMGMLLGGIMLGPSVLGVLWPDLQHAVFPRTAEQKAMLDGVSQYGILLLLLLTGMETDLKLVRTVGKASLSISVTGVAIPFICGFVLGQFLPEWLLPHPDQRLLTSLFLGTALSISSIKIVAAIVREMGFTRRNLGQIIVASAICEDSIGWVIIAIIFGLAQAGTIDVVNVIKSILGTAAFLLASFTVGGWIVHFLIRWTNDNFESEFPVITTILVIMGAMALLTHFIGVHTVLGAFVAGVLIGESPILTKHIDEQLRGLILAFFMPVFFGIAGLSADLTVLRDPTLLLMTLGLIAIASFGKFAGAFIGGEIGGLRRREAFALACGMNARGSTEVIIATIGLSMGALTQDLFTMIVTMAVATTMAMPPMLRWALARVPMGRAEKQRLEREEFEARGFVSNLERLLLAVDQSPNGKFAASLTVRKQDTGAGEAIAKEARKGYDLLFVGIENTRAKSGLFDERVSRIASAFEGPLAIVAGNGDHLREPQRSPLHILVPVTGNEVSRRAADAAVAIARACGGTLAALYVATSAASDRRKRRAFRARRQEQAIMKDIIEMADHRDVRAKPVVHSDVAARDAILAEAKKGPHDLIIMGVSRRPGDKLFFGDTAAAVFENAPVSIIFIAS